MSFFAIASLINFITASVFGLVAYWKNSSQKINQVFILMSAVVALWSLSYFFWQISSSEINAIFWVKALTVFSLFIPITYLHWVLSLTNKEGEKRVVLIAGYVVSIAFIFFIPSDFIVGQVVQKMAFSYWPDAGDYYFLYILLYIVIVTYSIGHAIQAMIYSPDKDVRNQLKYVVFASVVGFIGGATNFFLWYNIQVLPYGNIFISFYTIILGYATIRHGLMNIKTLFANLLIIVINIVYFVQIFTFKDKNELILNIVAFIFMGGLSLLLMKNIEQQVHRKEELQLMANQLSRANQRLRKLDRAKSEFISIASHQLRTPLTAVKGFISLILEGSYGKIEPPVQNALNKVYLSNERLIQLVEDLLSISRIESGRMEYKFKAWDMEEIIQEVYDLFAIRTRDKGVEFTFDKPEEKLPSIVIDGAKIREVISNLVDNAIKYTKEGYVHIKLEKKEEFLRISIKDTGIGILAEDAASLFGKFERGKDTDRLHADGTGLGLYVGKNLIEAHHGKIWAESEGRDKGSHFYIELPLDGMNRADEQGEMLE